MTNYNGPATVIADGGLEINVTAALTSRLKGLMTEWGGVITTSPETMFSLRNTSQAMLRLEDGQEGGIFLNQAQTITDTVEIMGNGDVPF
jgi:hypothetical protein